MRYGIFPAATVAIGVALVSLWTPSTAMANQFLFTGNCVAAGYDGPYNCGPIEGTLSLTNTYQFGSAITPADFLSMHYVSNDDDLDWNQITQASPGINNDGSLVGELRLLSNQYAGSGPGSFTITFTADQDGRWGILGDVNEGGTAGRFTPLVSASIPEPGTWAVLLVGFAAGGFTAFRSRKESAPASA